MGMKLTAMLKVEFEMEDGAPDNLAEIRLGTAVASFSALLRPE
jgi:hypothetical protein